MGYSICFCTTCRVMLCDPEAVDVGDMSLSERQDVIELDYTVEDVEKDGKLFFSKCPVCDTMSVMYRYESHMGGLGA